MSTKLEWRSIQRTTKCLCEATSHAVCWAAGIQVQTEARSNVIRIVQCGCGTVPHRPVSIPPFLHTPLFRLAPPLYSLSIGQRRWKETNNLYLIFVLRIRKKLESIKFYVRREKEEDEEDNGRKAECSFDVSTENDQGFCFFLIRYEPRCCCLNISRHSERHRLVNFEAFRILHEK